MVRSYSMFFSGRRALAGRDDQRCVVRVRVDVAEGYVNGDVSGKKYGNSYAFYIAPSKED